MSDGGAGHSRRRKKHAGHEEEHENHERWLVSYADMMTLLMVLFIVMFAISQVDQKKFNQLKDGLAGSFGAPVQLTTGGQATMEKDLTSPGVITIGARATQTQTFSAAEDAKVASKVHAELQKQGRSDASQQVARVDREVASMEATRRKIQAALKKAGLAGTAKIAYDARGLVVNIVTDKVLFASDRDAITPTAARIIDSVAPALKVIHNNIQVVGHTNNVKVDPKYFPSDWHLSGARAATVAQRLVERDGVAALRMTSSGVGDTRPLVPGTGALANVVNRRVEIVVLTTLGSDDAALITNEAPAGDPISWKDLHHG